MRTLVVISCAVLLAACGEPAADRADAGGATPQDIAWTQDYAACGFDLQDRTVWGAGVATSELEIQQVTAEPGLVLRVWSENAAGLEAGDGVLTGHAAAPAWISADVRPDTWLIRLDDGAADLRVTADGFFCAPSGAGA